MTKIVSGFAQPDIEATKGSEKVLIFVETPGSLKANVGALKKTYHWLVENEPETKLIFIRVKPRNIPAKDLLALGG